MKRLIFSLLLFATAFSAMAQSPQEFHVQTRTNQGVSYTVLKGTKQLTPPSGPVPFFPAETPDSMKCGSLFNLTTSGQPDTLKVYDCESGVWNTVGGGITYTFGSGLTDDESGNVTLTGTLTAPVDIKTNGTNTFTVESTTTTSKLIVGDFSTFLQSYTDGSGHIGTLLLDPSNTELTNAGNVLLLSPTSGFMVTTPGSKGIRYNSDYSTTLRLEPNALASIKSVKLIADSVKATISGGGTTTNPLTINNSGTGASSGSTFDGSAAKTISYNSIGAQPQLSGTGFVKASGTSISYDNSTYLTSVTLHPDITGDVVAASASGSTLSPLFTIVSNVNLTGNPTTTTQPTATSNTSIATTAFVHAVASAISVPVNSVFGRTGTVVAASNDYTFAQIGSKPTTLSGYGITDAQPLEDQRLSTTNSPSFVKESLLGTAGAGYLDILSQSASPAAGTGHLRLYSDSVNRLSWKNSIYRRTIQVPYPSDYTIRMPYKATGTTLEDSTHAAATYQTILSSGTTLKTVNSISLLGSGNLAVTTGNTDTTATGFMPKANTKTLAQLQTAFNLKANIASPTFTGTVTIPNGGVFGTPTSMTATNVTGLPLTTAVTGILPVANGGSGVGTITGLIKGNGTSNYSAATAGTDYNIPIVFTTTGTSGAATYNSGTGALNIPNYAVFTNPLTTLGDLPYGGASGALTKLAGNTTVARAFLSETESGGTAAAPAFFDLFGTTNTFSAAQTFSGAVTLNSLITTGTNNNFVQFSNVGAVATGNAQYQFAGSSNVTFRSAFGGGTTSSSVSNSNVYANSLTAQSVFSVATGVTIPWAVQQEVASFGTITLTGSGSVTNTAMLRVENATTSGTNNYSSWFGTGLYHYDGLTASSGVVTDANKNLISEPSGQTTLVAGTKAISITGLTTSSKAYVSFVSIGGTVSTTWQYAGVCTSGTLTITALTNAGTTDTTDTSIVNYRVIP